MAANNEERIYKAVRILIGPGPLRERLANAFRDEIQYLDKAKLSDMALVEFESMRDQLTKEEPNGDLDAIDLSCQQLSDGEIEDLSIQVLDMYSEAAKAEK